MADTENNKNSNSPAERAQNNAPALRFPGFNKPWQRVAVSQIAPLQRGFDLPTDKVSDGEFPIVYSNGILRHHNEYKCVAPGVITGRSGTIGKFTYIPKGFYWPHNTSLWVTDFCGNSPLFIYYLYQTINIGLYATGSGVPTLNRNDVHRHKTAIPPLNEQKKIAEFLQLLDERISTQRRLIEDFISLRRAILQDAIKKGLSKKSWKFTTLTEILTERGERNYNGYDVCSVSVSEGVVNQIEYLGRSFAAKETGHYNVARYGDIIYTKSPTGSFPYGIVKRNTQKEPAAISPLYGVFVPIHDWMGMLLGYYFESEVNTFNYLHPIIQKGAKNTINITNSGFLANSVPLPTSESEALTLAKCLDTITHKIVLEKSVLANYTDQREYFLSKMFV